MGTLFTITVYAPNPSTATNALDAAFKRIEELNMVFSDYEDASEVTLLRKNAFEKTMPVSEDMATLLEKSRELYRQTDGAFDPTLGLMIQHWRRARRQRTLPTEETLADVRKSIGFDRIAFDPNEKTLRILSPGLMFDFGGIAKGYAADEAMRTLREHGISRALIAASGDILAGSPPPGRAHWTVGVQSADVSGDAYTTILRLANRAVSTSGDASQYALIKGEKYSHIVDPKTGIGLTERIGVTILAPDATSSDSLATAVSIFGREKGLNLVESIDGTACLIVKEGKTGFERTRSSGFPKINVDSKR